MRGRRQVREQVQKRQGIVQVPQGIDESRVALLDNMVQAEFGRMVLLQARGVADFSAPKRASNLLGNGLLVTEFPKQRFVEKILDVLGVVKGGVGGRSLRGLLLAPRLTGINSWMIATSATSEMRHRGSHWLSSYL